MRMITWNSRQIIQNNNDEYVQKKRILINSWINSKKTQTNKWNKAANTEGKMELNKDEYWRSIKLNWCFK